ncbi:MAG: hypothetical protein PWP74_720 [Shewanella sp.]|jgi:hypothetical protein|uniref:Uncharacterized protein n=1 Tax=Shewanella fodinae TaxID=552357 RepID=A0A4R2FGS2_9GAMM|nr:hypothetical protein [Shewanella sp.]TCN81153.1 hypothetical protein EDC91_12619 [Shewanella fodinae]
MKAGSINRNAAHRRRLIKKVHRKRIFARERLFSGFYYINQHHHSCPISAISFPGDDAEKNC